MNKLNYSLISPEFPQHAEDLESSQFVIHHESACPPICEKTLDSLAGDRRKVAIHEAGHAVVALELGSPHVWLTLDRGYTGDPAAGFVLRGQCGTSELKGKVRRAALSYGGVLAEFLDDQFDICKRTAWEAIYMKSLIPSPSDMKCIDELCPMWHERAIQLSLNILQDNWEAVRGVAFTLHESHGPVLFSALYWKQGNWRGLL